MRIKAFLFYVCFVGIWTKSIMNYEYAWCIRVCMHTLKELFCVYSLRMNECVRNFRFIFIEKTISIYSKVSQIWKQSCTSISSINSICSRVHAIPLGFLSYLNRVDAAVFFLSALPFHLAASRTVLVLICFIGYFICLVLVIVWPSIVFLCSA